jgi:hypothetical protein
MMGEAKRRKQQDKPLDLAAARAFTKGKFLRYTLLNAAAIMPVLEAGSGDHSRTPRWYLAKRAGMMLERIKASELEPWRCLLCGNDCYGLADLSKLAIIADEFDDPAQTPSIAAPICHACDGIEPKEISRRIEKALGCVRPREGRA